MSSPSISRRQQRARRERGRFTRTFAITIAALVVLGGAGAAVAVAQGPRVSGVVVDGTAAAEASGQRIVFTANQALAEIDPDQVSLAPAAPFTVVAAGRHVAVQFTYPLDPDTEYAVSIRDVEGVAGGPTSTLSHTFRSGNPPLYILQRRSDGQDVVFATNLSGDEAVPVFTEERIEDFRAARHALAVLTSNASGHSSLSALDLVTGDVSTLPLPGTGIASGLQIAGHDDLVGYTFTDERVGTPGALEAALFIGSLEDPDAEPRHIAVGTDGRVQQWAFVPQTTYLLVLPFDGQLRLVDTAEPDADPISLGTAFGILGIEQGSGRAFVDRPEGYTVIDLTTLAEEPMVEPVSLDELGVPGPVSSTIEGATLRLFTQMGPDGYPDSQRVVRVSSEGEVATVFVLDDPGDAVTQVCASPSGRYAAITVAPDLVDNPYDLYLRPLPRRLETHIVDIRDNTPVSLLEGVDPSWCAAAPLT